jgi:hypothetical protein
MTFPNVTDEEKAELRDVIDLLCIHQHKGRTGCLTFCQKEYERVDERRLLTALRLIREGLDS